MIDLRSIARHLRLPVDQLRVAADLLVQGYQPAFIERYRSDETSGMPHSLLWALKLAIEKQQRLEHSRQRVVEHLHEGVELDSEAKERLGMAESEVEIESAMRAFRARRQMQQAAEREGIGGQLLEKLIAYNGPAIEDVSGWVQTTLGCESAAAEEALQSCKRLIASLTSGDTAIAQRLRQTVQRRANIKVNLIADPNKPNTTAAATDGAAGGGTTIPADSAAAAEADPIEESGEGLEAVEVEVEDVGLHDGEASSIDDEHGLTEDIEGDDSVSAAAESEVRDESTATTEESATDDNASATTDASTTSPLKPAVKGAIAKKGKKKKAKEKPSAKALAKISPRQRRRRWLISMLQPFHSLQRPLSKLSAYQQLMIGRGRRSQLVSVELQYDVKALVTIIRDAFVSDKHPLVSWFSHAIEESMTRPVLNRVEHDAIAELEEAAQQKLFEVATEPLREQLEQRPVRGHRILVIDAVGPKTSSVAIVDARGRVLHTTEITCSAQPQTVTQNVVKLGELAHRYRITLVALTNGPARRFLVHTLRELVTQSAESGLRWTMVDRGGAEAYAASRAALQELPEHNRRDRATIWIARRLQDPLNEMVKLDTSRLRLGSYQRELPAEPLKRLVADTIADSVCSRGIDTLWASVSELMTVPGVQKEQAEQIVRLVGQGKINSRDDLLAHVTDWPEQHSRQAIGFLRVFGSPNSFDATAIHPDDYKLAERLVQNAGLAQPPAAPPGWARPTLVVPQAETASTPHAEEPAAVTAEAITESAPAEIAATGDPSAAVTANIDPDSSSIDVAANSDLASTADAASNTETPAAESTVADDSLHAIAPEYPENCTASAGSEVSIDVEKLARGWQVGRGKLRWIASCLQDPFGDQRLGRTPVPMLQSMPSLESLEPGTCLWAVVVGVADFGAFVELGPECNGLIHISRLSQHFVEDPHQCVQVGDLIQAWVVSIDGKKRRVAMTAISPQQRQAASVAQQQRAADAAEARSRGPRPDRGGQERPAQQGDAQRRGGQAGGQQAGQGRGQQAGRGQGGFAGAGRGRGNQGQGQGQGQQGGNRGGQRGNAQRGGGQGGGGRRGRSDSNQSIVVTSKKPKDPITQGMQQGIEPLRSFSDLLQFYELKRTDPPAAEVPPPASKESNEPPPAAETE